MKNLVKISLVLAAAALTLSGCNCFKKMGKKQDEVTYSCTPKVLTLNNGVVSADITVNFPAAYFNKKAYTDPALRKEYTNKGFWVNIRLIRYSDVVLMAAEAANEKNIPGEAIDYLEMVRARARGSNTNILPKVTTTDQGELREAIRHERRVELGLEFDRFYDLVRWGIAADVLHAAGKVNYQAKNALLPLPQSEIDKSKGVLVQNPDY